MSWILDKAAVAKSRHAASQHAHVVNTRRAARNIDVRLAADEGIQLDVNVGRVPQDVYRDFDNTTKQLMTGDEGGVLLNDLLPLARSVDIGKITSEYRKVSDSGLARSSISGQHSKPMDHVAYDYEGTLVLIHDSSFGREWREMEAMRSEGFDPIVDDQAASVRAVRRQMFDNFTNGSPLVFKGVSSYGIKNNPATQALNLGAGGLNIDLTSASTTFAQMQTVLIAALTVLQGRANNVEQDIDFYVSPEIWFNMLRVGTNDTRFSTFLAGLQATAGVRSIKKTNGLTGNQFYALALNSQFIQPVVGMGVTTTPIFRTMPMSDYNWLTWCAAGLLIKRDGLGRSGALFAS
jgi:hypothetical protein